MTGQLRRDPVTLSPPALFPCPLASSLTLWPAHVVAVSVLVDDLQRLLLPFKTPFHFLPRGRHCETFVDVCPQMPCLNGGTCAVASNMPDGFICRCPPVSACRPRKEHALFCAVCDGAESKSLVFQAPRGALSVGRFPNFSSFRRKCLSFPFRVVKMFPETVSSLSCRSS